MGFTRARLRYLAAMGVAAAPAVSACKSAEPPSVTLVDGGVGTATTGATAVAASATAPATATVAATETATGSPTPPTVTPPTAVPYMPHLPSCPHGTYCVAEPAHVARDGGAPAPYERCSAMASDPKEPRAAGPGGGPERMVSFDVQGTRTARASDPKACCYQWVIPCPGGRALRASEHDEPRVTPVRSRGDWARDVDVTPLPRPLREVLAAHWAREASAEHASVASFAYATLDLLAVGAPPELVADVQAAALDEVEHARIAFSLASAYASAPVGPDALAPLPPRAAAPTLASVAHATFVDACVGETIGALAAGEASRMASDPTVRAALARIAEDEERHAELAWRTVAWALRSGGSAVREAIERAARSLRAEATASEPGDVVAAVDLGAHGVLAPRALRELRARTLREVVLPCVERLLRGCA